MWALGHSQRRLLVIFSTFSKKRKREKISKPQAGCYCSLRNSNRSWVKSLAPQKREHTSKYSETAWLPAGPSPILSTPLAPNYFSCHPWTTEAEKAHAPGPWSQDLGELFKVWILFSQGPGFKSRFPRQHGTLRLSFIMSLSQFSLPKWHINNHTSRQGCCEY